MNVNVDLFCVEPDCALKQAIARMNSNRLGIILVVDKEQHLLGTITDGDIRRAILGNVGLNAAVSLVLENKAGTQYAKPLTAQVGRDRSVYLQLLKKHQVLHLPILDANRRVVGLVTMDEFVPYALPSMQAVVMAGGRGTRLLPLTEDLPKPMLPVGDKPLLEIIIEQLRSVGIQQVNVTTHHKPEKITQHFGDGKGFGVNLSYVSEDRPLGTAGALGLMETPKDTLLVINGDVLTEVNFKAMLQYHREHKADLTVAVHTYEVEVPYGVLECDGVAIKGLKEKPSVSFLVNAGIYLLEPKVHSYIPTGEHYNMTDLIQRLIDEGRPVVSFPIHEYWLDIGRYAEYQQAQEYDK